MYTLQPKTKTSARFKTLAIVGSMVLGMFICGGFMLLTPATNVADDFDACWMAQKFVKEQLKAPSTATFAPCRQPDTVVNQTERIWHVRSWVDAENSFGALLRNNFNVDLIYYPSTDSWTLVDLSMSE